MEKNGKFYYNLIMLIKVNQKTDLQGGLHMQNNSEAQNSKLVEKKEQQIARIMKLLQSATLNQLENLEAFIMSYLN